MLTDSGGLWFALLGGARAAGGMLRAAAGLREIGVSVFQNRVLVAMAELTSQGGVSIMMVLWLFGCAFCAVGIIIGNLGHGSFPYDKYLFSGVKVIRQSVRWKKPRACAGVRAPAMPPENADSVG